MTASESPPPPRPSFLDSLIRLLVWSSVVGTLAVPVLLIALFNSQIIVSFPFLGDNGFNATFNKLFPSRPTSGIVTADGGSRAAQIERLRAMTARPEMASGAALQLHVVAVAFDEEKPEPSPASNAPVVDPDGYRRVSLDLSRSKDAVVVIADQPLRWSVAGAGGAWGRIGFEGLAPFDVSNGRPNLLAGFRIGAFGARETARAVDPFHADQRRQRALCNSVRLWSEHFGVTTTQVTFALIANPTRIALDGTIVSDGQLRRSWTGTWLNSLCKQ